MKLNTDYINCSIIRDENTENQKISCSIIRFDRMHPLISGNKFFKLSGYIRQFHEQQKKGILTVGGAFSNHLAATAHYCNKLNIPCIGIVRGEKPGKLSHTLSQCEKDNMQLIFLSREEYTSVSQSAEIAMTHLDIKNYLFIPEGGFGETGALGASLMSNYFLDYHPTHVVLPVGTATTLAGILSSVKFEAKVIGIPVLKGMKDIDERLSAMLPKPAFSQLTIWDEFHFGGYAKYNQELLDFMNDFYFNHKVPTDFVYTGKMMFALMKKIKTGYFESGSNIIVIHTGGLQGNLSLPQGSLIYL